jgi:hypothetical protein
VDDLEGGDVVGDVVGGDVVGVLVGDRVGDVVVGALDGAAAATLRQVSPICKPKGSTCASGTTCSTRTWEKKEMRRKHGVRTTT